MLVTTFVRAGGRVRKGYGSGAIISADGFILTCTHVIEKGFRCEVTLANGKVFKAKQLGWSTKQDFALLKIDGKNLPYYSIGNSAKLKLGQWVMALGHPGGPYPDRRPAVSVGTITGLNRALVLRNSGKFYNKAIRTDIPIYMGNSGGPLVDLDGKLLGLNGAIILFNQNSYSVPIHQVMSTIAKLKKGERFTGASPSVADMAKMRQEISPKDMQKIYGNLGKQFYRITVGKVLKTVKKWWNRLFNKKKK